MTSSDRTLFALFAGSGFAALVYQVVWQRSLFAIYGINVEAVTVVVTAFMLGLGIGSLAGGWLSRDPERPPLRTFAAINFLGDFFHLVPGIRSNLLGLFFYIVNRLVLGVDDSNKRNP